MFAEVRAFPKLIKLLAAVELSARCLVSLERLLSCLVAALRDLVSISSFDERVVQTIPIAKDVDCLISRILVPLLFLPRAQTRHPHTPSDLGILPSNPFGLRSGEREFICRDS